MANNPQKAKDATEEALSAIQEALNVRAPEAGASPDADKELTSPVTPAPADRLSAGHFATLADWREHAAPCRQ